MEDTYTSIKEQRIREITFMYYSRPEIKKVLYSFSKNRECVPRYFEGFGKRPDTFQYDTDVNEFVNRGATSFHCSEEIWQDPLEISTDLSRQEFNDLRIGWDLLLDIDSKYLEYSKIYAELLIDTLRFHGIKNIGVKFSGSKGFHVIIPWKAFPKEIYKQKTKDMFPEWPRIICEYLSDMIKSKLENKIFELQGTTIKELAEKTGKKVEDLLVRECMSCKRPAKISSLITWYCDVCRSERVMPEKNKRVPKCPDCRKLLVEQSREDIYVCEYCSINSKKNPEMFDTKGRFASEKLIDADLILVAPRHLFRMPYSLHEKTALASIVIDKDHIKDFQITDARPLKVNVKDFYPEPEPEEAKSLLLQALDWKEQKDKKDNHLQEQKNKLEPLRDNKDNKQGKQKPGTYQKLVIENPSVDIYPPCIKLLIKGVKQDGRKRALFILINFFKSLGVSDETLQKKLVDWNELNYIPLKKGYIETQLIWSRRNHSLMPPNCDKPNYKDLGVCHPDELCRQIKNPVNYSAKKFFKFKK